MLSSAHTSAEFRQGIEKVCDYVKEKRGKGSFNNLFEILDIYFDVAFKFHRA